MREGLMWQIMLKYGTFTPHQILAELNPPSFLKEYAKKKLYSLINSQLKAGLLEVISDTPYVLQVKISKPAILQDDVKRHCQICGKPFYPFNQSHVYCNECKSTYRKEKCKEIRRSKGARVDYFWTPEEVEKLKEAFPELKFNRKKAIDLSMQIGRSITAIHNKLKALRRQKHEKKHENCSG